jgi:uncharacterized membrane protein required for colicin V production
MEAITPFDLVSFIVLLGMFILGYMQGVTRRLFGLVAILFSLGVAIQVRQPLGSYLAQQWTNAPAEYAYMVAFGAVFLALAIALTIGIQVAYRPEPLFPKYPVLDEILGGLIGLLEGFIVLMILVLVMDPYYAGTAGKAAAAGEFLPLRSVWEALDPSLTASIMREGVLPGVVGAFRFLVPEDIAKTFAVIASRLA